MKEPKTIQEKMTVADVAALLGSSRYTVYRHVKSGLIPSFRLGRKVLLDPIEVMDALRQKTNQEKSELQGGNTL